MREIIEMFGGHMMSDVPNPYPVYAELRQRQPVRPIELPLGPTFMVTRYDDVVTVLKDGNLYSSASNGKGIGLVMGRTIIEMDGAEHARHRNIVAPAFLPKAMKGELSDVIHGIAHQLIDRLAKDGRAELVSQFTRSFPVRVIAHIIGVPIDDFDTFQRWSFDLIGFASDPPKGFAAAQALVEFLRPIVESRKAEPRDDLLSTLVHAEVDGHRLTDEEIYSFLRLLMPAGAETTYRLIGTTLLALLRDPEQLEQVRSDRSELDWALEEALRWDTPVQFVSRETTAPTAIRGVAIPAGVAILVAIGSANRDESRFDEPGRYDLNRRRDDHVSFGFGRHFCVGSHLARLEARTALNAILDRLPNLRLDASQESQVVGLAFRSPNRVPVFFDA